MIVKEYLEGDLVKTYSDAGFLIHGGMPEGDYSEAIDPVSMHREYIETDIPIPVEEEEEVEPVEELDIEEEKPNIEEEKLDIEPVDEQEVEPEPEVI